MNRAMVFIDGQNLYHATPEYLNLDYLELRDFLAGDLDCIRTYYFDSFPTEEQIRRSEEEEEMPTLSSKQDFYHLLRMNGFRVVAKPLRERGDRFVEKGSDIRLATELIAQGFNDSYDVAIVVTGDLDFEKPIKYVQDQGKIVKLAMFERNVSSDLKTVPDEYIPLDEHVDQISR